MNETRQLEHEEDVAIRTAIQAGDQMMGSGNATSGNDNSDPSRNSGIMGSGT